MCRNYIFGHSYGTTLQNWLIARSLLKKLPPGIYWTGLNATENQNKLGIIWELMETSIYNPIWATDEPHGSTDPFDKCIALDLRSEASVGWRLVNCTERLPTLCETFACMGDDFRCLDNTRCIPRSAVYDGIIDCGDGSDERARLIAGHGFEQDRKYSQFSSNDCQNVVVTLPEGTIASPNYPGNYPQRKFCQWNIRAQPGQIIIINVEDIALAPGDTLSLEGNQEGRQILTEKWQLSPCRIFPNQTRSICHLPAVQMVLLEDSCCTTTVEILKMFAMQPPMVSLSTNLG
ncbi:Low-density lipoprotein receptor domain class A, partial [Ostertagia ostertagi]